jgi:hypothetical protein
MSPAELVSAATEIGQPELVSAATEIGQRWPDALIYPNIASRNPHVPENALAVDIDRVWPHDCDGESDCTGCLGEYRLVAWIDILGNIHVDAGAGR